MIKRLLKDYNRYFTKVVTHTTRRPRSDEVHGVSYYFVSKEAYSEMLLREQFLESATVHGNFYGVSKTELERAQKEQKIPLIEVDIQGARTFKSIACSLGLVPKCLFVEPVSLAELRHRLEIR